MALARFALNYSDNNLKIKQMKKFSSLYLFATEMILVFTACSPIYKCGDEVPAKKPGGKRMKAVVEERDQFCTDLSIKVAENTELNTKLNSSTQQNRNLNEQLTDLNRRYNSLINESLSQSEQYNEALRLKNQELLERERRLAEMQSIIARQDSITQRLNNIVRNALLGFNSDELSVELRNGKVYVSMSNKLLFSSGSAAVEAKGREALQALAVVLNNNPDIDVLVEGHTDNVPIRTNQFRDNWDLSVIRATSIVRILTVDFNVAPLRVTASGKGEFMPKADNSTPEGRALNRRTEIILSPKLDELMKMLEGN
jgi:chemotaxis protein MotB